MNIETGENLSKFGSIIQKVMSGIVIGNFALNLSMYNLIFELL
jgi:hypothetical protein